MGRVIVGNSFLSGVHIKILLANYHPLLKLMFVTNTYLDDTKAYKQQSTYSGSTLSLYFDRQRRRLGRWIRLCSQLAGGRKGAAVVKQEEELLVT